MKDMTTVTRIRPPRSESTSPTRPRRSPFTSSLVQTVGPRGRMKVARRSAAFGGAGAHIAGEQLVPDEPERIRAALEEAKRTGARAVIFNGGTGIGRRDCTIETLQPFFEKTLPGFGEIFRSLSYRDIGSAAMMSRATAGTYQGMVVFALPGSPNAVKLGVEALILPELGHAARELVR